MRFIAMLLALGIAGAGAGCAEKAVELRLVMPTGDAADLDVSCVETVHVVMHDNMSAFGTLPSQCIDVSSPTSLADLQEQIRGKLNMDFPDTVVAIDVRGLTATIPGQCGVGMAMFYAGEEYVGQEQVSLKVEASMDCSAVRVPGEHRVRPVDFLALADTPANEAPICQSPRIANLTLGTIRPTNIDVPDFPTSLMELGVFTGIDSATGIAKLPAWGTPEASSCLAVAPFSGVTFQFEMFSASCIYPGNATVCGEPGEVELPLVPPTATGATIDPEIASEFPVLVIGAVWDTTTKRPVEGAEVKIDPARGVVVYADRGAGERFDPLEQATATNKSGLFLAYMREPSVATVTQGTSTKKLRLGGDMYLGAAAIVPLR